MADAVDSKSAGETRVGSTPTFGTKKFDNNFNIIIFMLKLNLCGGSSAGRASAFQAECREFESRPPLPT